MNANVPPFPARPDEVQHGVGLAALVGQYNAHQYEVLARSRRQTDAADDELFAHAVAALAVAQALVDRLQTSHWSTIRAALAEDVSRAPEVAAACALDGAEVAAGLRSWAAGQVEAGLMRQWEYGVVGRCGRPRAGSEGVVAEGGEEVGQAVEVEAVEGEHERLGDAVRLRAGHDAPPRSGRISR